MIRWIEPVRWLGDVTIPDAQRDVHVAAETVAVVAVAPFMIWLAFQRGLPTWARVASAVIGVGTLVVDGGLLWKYSKESK